jgi:hypothetical protein
LARYTGKITPGEGETAVKALFTAIAREPVKAARRLYAAIRDTRLILWNVLVAQRFSSTYFLNNCS